MPFELKGREPYGQINFLDNTIESISGDVDIQIGLVDSTANLVFNRDVILANSKTLSVTGTITVANTNFAESEAALLLTSSVGAARQPASNPGYMIHTTGIDGVASRIVADAFSDTPGHYSAFIARRGRGTAASPSAVQDGDIIARFAGNAFGDTKFSQFGDGRVEVHASGNHTDSSKPTKIVFFTTPTGTNTATEIATFDGDSVQVDGYIKPLRGFVHTPRLPVGAQTSIVLDYITDSVIKANCDADLTFTHTNFVAGKVVEVWITNTTGQGHTITHGCAAINSTTNSTTINIPSTSSMHLKFFSIGGELANTFVAVTPSA